MGTRKSNEPCLRIFIGSRCQRGNFEIPSSSAAGRQAGLARKLIILRPVYLSSLYARPVAKSASKKWLSKIMNWLTPPELDKNLSQDLNSTHLLPISALVEIKCPFWLKWRKKTNLAEAALVGCMLPVRLMLPGHQKSNEIRQVEREGFGSWHIQRERERVRVRLG